jgi:serine phosphatase RsbU (regulator of sigma subunit)/anti-sigma regulatory factor (Ser/Thr protein kinase)
MIAGMTDPPPSGEPPAAEREQLQALGRITDAALASLSVDQLLRELLLRISEILSSDTAALLLLDETGTLLRARAAKGIEEEVEQGVTIPLGRGFAGRIAAERRAIFIEDVDHADVLNPILRQKGIHSLLGVPLVVEQRVLGVLHIGSLVPRRFTTEEAALLQLAADRAAIAIEHATLYEQRLLAEALQRRLLPTDLSVDGGVQLASRYLPASHESLGGDWYDAFAIGGGKVAVAIGDVVGHGIPAAAVMAQLRTALRAYAVEGHPSHQVLELVNRLMNGIGPRAMTTLAYGVIDSQRGTLELVVAGHPPPLLISPAGESAYLEPDRVGIPLGVSELARYASQTFPFEPGSTVLLYTDGLVETRSEPIDVGLERLRAVATGNGGVEALCARIIARLAPSDRHDDVALLAARVDPVPERLHGRWPAERNVLAGVRQLLRRWLETRGASDDEIYDIVVASQEACANAVEHAYRPGHHSFELDATYDDGRVRVTIRDAGTWRPPRGTHRGRGVMMMRGLMDSVDIDHTDAGTTVVLERMLGAKAA